MAICDDCGQEMLTAEGCIVLTVNVNNEDMARLAYGKDTRALVLSIDTHRRCHDCGVTWEHLHHPGCDMEECPACHGQFISCNCIVQ